MQTEQIYLAPLLQYFQKLTTSRSVLVHLRGLPVITTLFKSDPVLMKTLLSTLPTVLKVTVLGTFTTRRKVPLKFKVM